MQRLAVLIFVLLVAVGMHGQINTPMSVSQRGSISQRIGFTDISIEYGRPAANNRKLWGELVPYGKLWRAGANENTVFTVSTDVNIGGKVLAAGKYGVHMIPSETDWTIIFSTDSRAWGSYFYNREHDALRFTVTPTIGAHAELLTFEIPQVTASSANIQLHWGTLIVPITVSVDLAKTVGMDLERQLTGVSGFTPENHAIAAEWLSNIDPNNSLITKWTETALKGSPSFTTLMLAAKLEEKQKQSAKASEFRAKAMDIGTNAQINAYGYQLLQSGKIAESIPVFEKNSKRFPTDPNVWDSLGEAYAMNKNKKSAIECFMKALSMNPAPDVRTNSESWLEKLKASN